MATKKPANGSASEPEDVLRELTQITKDRKALERREATLVRRARRMGYVWEDIAASLGVSKQAVHKKYSGGAAGRR
jgi:hypothetical protein